MPRRRSWRLLDLLRPAVRLTAVLTALAFAMFGGTNALAAPGHSHGHHASGSHGNSHGHGNSGNHGHSGGHGNPGHNGHTGSHGHSTHHGPSGNHHGNGHSHGHAAPHGTSGHHGHPGNTGGHGGPGHTTGGHNPGGNNGTIKIDGVPFDDAPNNEPHVGCKFQVDFYGYDQGNNYASVLFADHPQTADGGLTVTSGQGNPSSVFIGEDDASGGGSQAGLDASETYTLAFTGAPHPKQGYHVKLTVHAPGSKGADTKHKVFWVKGCSIGTPPPPPPPPPGHHHHHHGHHHHGHHHGHHPHTPPHHHGGPPSHHHHGGPPQHHGTPHVPNTPPTPPNYPTPPHAGMTGSQKFGLGMLIGLAFMSGGLLLFRRKRAA